MINETIIDEDGIELQCHIQTEDKLVVNIYNTQEPQGAGNFLSIVMDEEMCEWLIKQLTILKNQHFTV